MNRFIHALEKCGLSFLVPILRLIRGENLDEQIRGILLNIGVPILAFVVFLGIWSSVAKSVEVSFGSLPGPAAVWTETKNLWAGHVDERRKATEFNERQAERKQEFLERFPDREWKDRKYAAKPTYIDQIFTSLKTVFAGFLIASLVAVPLGILCGLSKTLNTALNPFIQIFKPVSPLAWLPIVMILVSALYNPEEPLFAKSFISSAVTVSLCSLWPTLINTAVGVASIDNDYLNVARVLKLGWFRKIRTIVLPSALPYIFTGLRLSLGVGWMVLIAAEMLAQNPGLGKFVWDMFQNGSSQTLAQIMVAVFTVGLIGFVLDRTMMLIQKAVSFDGASIR
ncbi:MAG TPA: ABC transporter permease [Methylomirabilota bacterium]|nr:ABC transporter permease [Methylomirabilota bacterium]